MLAAEDAGTAAVYGRYNAVGAAAGALGVAGGDPARPRAARSSGGVHGWLFLVLVPVGISRRGPGRVPVPGRRSPAAAASPLEPVTRARSRLGPSRAVVRRLAGLFAVDAAGGGLVTTGFLSYYFTERYHVSVVALGWLFFAVVGGAGGLGRAGAAAGPPVRPGRHHGRHPPAQQRAAGRGRVRAHVRRSLRCCCWPAPRCRRWTCPTRQALVMTVVTPRERTAAAAVTNAARYTVRPVGPLVAGLVQQLALGAPLVVAGAVKAGYDLALWRWARHLGLASRRRPARPALPPGLPLPPHPGSRHDRLPAHRRRPARMAGPVPGLDRRRPRHPPAARHPRRAGLRARRARRRHRGDHHLAQPRGLRRLDRHARTATP